MNVLKAALEANPADAKARYYLGNLFYDKKRYEEAISEWEESVDLDGSFSIPWRNLGMAYFNVRKDAQRALTAYEKAFALNPGDARLLYELDQLRKRMGVAAAQRLATLEQHPDLVAHRDDLTVEVITLLNQTSQPQKALTLLSSRRFNPWEGGEGLVSGQYVWTHLLLGRSRLESGQAEEALKHFAAARDYPHNLGEGKHLLTPETHLDYFAGVALSQLGCEEEAREYWSKAVEGEAPITWMTYYQVLSYRALGRRTDAKRTLDSMRNFAERQMQAEVKIDYFATSLPNFLLFEDDLQKRNQIDCLFILALAELGEEKAERATALFKQILAMDGNHLAAHEELRCLGEIFGEPAEALHPH
jgi:tetratricopeptide (TPR) repeat protein